MGYVDQNRPAASMTPTTPPPRVAALYVLPDSIYHSLPVDAWDAKRDARAFQGPCPVVAHPPCRPWGRLRQQAKPDPEERELGPLAVHQVQTWGGVLEHPAASSLWPHCNLPRPGTAPDQHGGHTIDVNQSWWGHRAQKRTWLYVVGCPPANVPPMPLTLHLPPRVITNIKGLRSNMPGYRKECTARERAATPPAFACWLIALAQLCHPPTPIT